MNQIKAVFFDIDGTLVSFESHQVPLSAKKALAQLQASGVKIFIATGRMLPMITIVDDIPFDGYITYNGAYCVNEKKEVIYSNPIPKDDLELLANYLETDSFSVTFMLEDEMTVNFVSDRVKEIADHINVDVPRIEDPHITIQRDVYQVCLYVDTEKEQEVLKKVFKHCASNRWSPVFADVNVSINNKQTGIDRILEHYDIDLSETMAFGDGGNDIPMLQHVAVGVAMGNASDEVKASADYVTDSVDDDGIANALRYFGLIE
ncbi:MAG: Cof-type HAD-IIB family hydrolase [Tannerella sp.]|jgi:Cof subfamily protein (haloacid dehalogenase superfamily)|nr:Cof-type HAD-IIB family hydrolase [Tannerella sp.]